MNLSQDDLQKSKTALPFLFSKLVKKDRPSYGPVFFDAGYYAPYELRVTMIY